MVQRLSGPGAPSPAQLGAETGIDRTTLARWKRKPASQLLRTPNAMTSRPSMYLEHSPQDKFRLVQEASQLSDENLGTFLRKNGIHQAQLEQWREQMISVFSQRSKPSPKKTSSKSRESKEIRKLKNELRRKEKALAEAAALLLLQKKIQDFWGDEDENI